MADQIPPSTGQNSNFEPEKKSSYWSRLAPAIRSYIIFGLVTVAGMAYANHRGWYPTYGLFSGENSMHSSSHHGYYGGFGIHGK